MAQPFKGFDYEATLSLQINLRQALPEDHLARFVVEVISQLDLSKLYERYGNRGGEAYPPEILLALLFYGYANGIFSSRKLERATYDQLPLRYITADLHPDHDTIANFRARFLVEIEELFVQILLLAAATGYLHLGNISLDGTKIHADASKSKAVSYKRIEAVTARIRAEVSELLQKSGQNEENILPEEMNVADEIKRREERLARLAEAKGVLSARAAERDKIEQEEYEYKLAQYQAKAKARKRRGKEPKPPKQKGPRDGDQYNFTDPDSRVMKNSKDKGFDQHYNGQIAVCQESMLIVGNTLSNHANDYAELKVTLESIPAELGKPISVAVDCGYFSKGNIAVCNEKEIASYIATGREPHGLSWPRFFAKQEEGSEGVPAMEASDKEKMAYKLATPLGKAVYRLRKCTVEPAFGIIKEVLNFRQFSLRGIEKVRGEWNLVCLSFNLKRLHTLKLNKGCLA